jgi:3-oxoacyl-[acyl-carrier-protein] synthase II
MNRSRVVITGIGVISSLGSNMEEIITAIKENRVYFKRSSIIQNVLTCPVSKFDFKDHVPRFKYLRYLPRSWQFIICAAKNAIIDSYVTKEDLEEAGLFVGVGPNVESIYKDPTKKALGLLSILPNTVSFCISNLFNIHGENLTISNACSSSLQAIGEGFLRIKRGAIKLALCGGGDSRLSRAGIYTYYMARVLKTIDQGDPSKVYAPFDRENSGFAPGEGGGFLVLEELTHAQKRGAKIYGEILGYSSSMDSENPTAPDIKAIWSSRCVKKAIERANLSKTDIEIIFSHGTGTPLNDKMEINLIKKIFLKHNPYISALKSWIGHIASGCGAVEMAIGIMAMKNKLIPGIRNLKSPRDKNLNFLFSNLSGSFKNAIFQSFGFGGQNAAVVVKIN